MDAVHRGGTRSLPGATPRSGTRCPIDSCPRSGRPGGVHPNPGSRRRENIPRTGAPAQGHVKVKATVQVAQRPPGCGVERAIAPELPGRSSPGSPVDVKVEVKDSILDGFHGKRRPVGRRAWGFFLEKRSRRPGIDALRRDSAGGCGPSRGNSKPSGCNSAKRDKVPDRLLSPVRAARGSAPEPWIAPEGKHPQVRSPGTGACEGEGDGAGGAKASGLQGGRGDRSRPPQPESLV